MKTVSFAIHKGGTGKTTTVVNLSAWLAKKGKRVLLIDMDAQANATECLADLSSLTLTLRDVLLGNRKLPDVICHFAPIPNLHFVPSTPALLLDEYWGRFTGLMPLMLKEQKESLTNAYDYVMCDCPPNLLHFTKLALFASDYIVMPVTPEPLATQGLTQLVENILPDLMKSNPLLKIGGVIVVHRVPRTRRYLPAEARAVIDHVVPGGRFSVEIPVDVNLAEMRDYHQPVCVFAEYSMGSWYFESLADEFIRRIPLI